MSNLPSRRVGLFGGSFDPVHLAHVALARVALEHLQLDELRWVPVGDAWQKQRTLSPAVHRAAMVELAIEGESRFVLEPCELARSGPSYTLETVKELQAREPTPCDWFLVIGQDQYAHFDSWHGWRELLDRVTLAVAGRAGVAPRAAGKLIDTPHQVRYLPLPPMTISATEIRARVARHEPIDTLVPAEVARYIAQHRLYLTPP